MAQFQFDASTVEPQKSFDLLPAGKYIAQIIESEVVDTKSGTGQYIKLTFEILEGEHTNRRVWARLNVANQNAEAEKIGQAQFSSLCHAAGRVRINDTSELHMIPVEITVKVRKDKTGEYGDQNDVSGFASVGGKPPAQAASAKQSPPWAKKTA